MIEDRNYEYGEGYEDSYKNNLKEKSIWLAMLEKKKKDLEDKIRIYWEQERKTENVF